MGQLTVRFGRPHVAGRGGDAEGGRAPAVTGRFCRVRDQPSTISRASARGRRIGAPPPEPPTYGFVLWRLCALARSCASVLVAATPSFAATNAPRAAPFRPFARPAFTASVICCSVLPALRACATVETHLPNALRAFAFVRD